MLSAEIFNIHTLPVIQSANQSEYGYEDDHDFPRAYAMKPTNELNWWIDHTGSTHTHCAPTDPHAALATGIVYLDSKAGVITHLNNKPADLSLISHELLDVLHAQFPGTRWWIKDTTPANAPKHQTAS